MKKIILLIFIISILFLAGFLRFYGIHWGIPNKPFWRNHYQDEAFVLNLILKMDPPDFNPHYFINPTFHYYTLLLSLKFAHFLGFIRSFSLPVPTNYLGQPIEKISLEDYRKMYYVGRSVSIIQGIILVFLIFLIATKLYNERVGLIAALFTAVLPSHVYQSHFLVVDAPGVFWLVLAYFILTIKLSQKRPKLWYLLAGIFIGLAIGVKYTNLLIIFPFLYKVYRMNKKKKTLFLKKIINRDTFITGVVAILTFFITTPYALLSFREFLYGDENGFGGIFGPKGLFYYNAYPPNLFTPFTVATFHSLRLPLTILTFLGLIYLIYKRTESDLFLLLFIIPFYLMLIYRASPHLRHILPILPFLMISLGKLATDFTQKLKLFPKLLTITAFVFTFIYTLLFSLAMVRRMTPIDTRVETALWVKENIPKESTIGFASFFPWNYTPPIEMITEKIVVSGYDYENLLKLKPDYFIITEYEYREFANSREPKFICEIFVEKLFSGREYKVVKKFFKNFEILGIKFTPNFPNMEWNPINPRIFIFKSINN